MFTDVRDRPDSSGDGLDDTLALIVKFMQLTGRVVVVLAAGVDSMTLELFEAGNRRQLGPVQ